MSARRTRRATEMLALGLLACCLVGLGRAEQPAAEPKVSPSGYIEYWPGTLPVILSAPHGGQLSPDELPDRTFGTLQRDSHTIELTMVMREALTKAFGAAPTVIVCRLSRQKLDCNREIVEAAQGNATAEKAWKEYHAMIEEAERDLLKRHPNGLFLDIHGHAHPKSRIELGYALTADQLQLPDTDFDKLAEKCSLRNLQVLSGKRLSDLLRGASSLGAMLGARGVDCVPAPGALLEPGDLYFDGGYNIRQHGPMQGGKIDAIQLEHPKVWRDTKESRAAMAGALASALAEFWRLNYGSPLK